MLVCRYIQRTEHPSQPVLLAGFLVWVFPSMYISQKTRLAKYLGANIILWGIIMALHAIPRSFAPFFVLRLILGQWHTANDCVCALIGIPGMLESCVAPILILIISMFYKKNEQVSRIISP